MLYDEKSVLIIKESDTESAGELTVGVISEIPLKDTAIITIATNAIPPTPNMIFDLFGFE